MFEEDSVKFFSYDISLSNFSGVALGDIERDGDFDIIFANKRDDIKSMHHLYINDGIGNFTDVSEMQLPLHYMTNGRDANFIDIDADLDRDCAIYEGNGGSNTL